MSLVTIFSATPRCYQKVQPVINGANTVTDFLVPVTPQLVSLTIDATNFYLRKAFIVSSNGYGSAGNVTEIHSVVSDASAIIDWTSLTINSSNQLVITMSISSGTINAVVSMLGIPNSV